MIDIPVKPLILQGFLLALLAAVVLLVLADGASGKTITVDDDGGADYTKIAQAVSAANNGDRIFINDGEYLESVTVNKRIEIEGEARGNTKVHGDPAMEVTADGVTISGLWFSCFSEDIGLVVSAKNCSIEDCMLGGVSSLRCILFEGAEDSTVTNCEISRGRNDGYCIGVEGSRNISIRNCEIRQGILIQESEKITISGNDWPGTDRKRIAVSESEWNVLEDVNATMLQLIDAHNTTIRRSTFLNNTKQHGLGKYGITIQDSKDNRFTDVESSGNDDGGIRFDGDSSGNVLTRISTKDNRGLGILLAGRNNTLTEVDIILRDTSGSGVLIWGTGHILRSVLMNGGGIRVDDPGGDFTNITHSIDETNLVNGSPIHVLFDTSDHVIPEDAGQIILIRCSNITASGQRFSGVGWSVQMHRTRSVVLYEQTHTGHHYAVQMSFCENVTLDSNTMEGFTVQGSGIEMIRIEDSVNCVLRNNTITADKGIMVRDSTRITITGNILHCMEAIHVRESANCNVLRNVCTEYLWGPDDYTIGIKMDRSVGPWVSGNRCSSFETGISIYRCEDMLVDRNEALFSNVVGISVTQSEAGKVSANRVENGEEYGFLLSESTNILYIANVVDGNPRGMLAMEESGNITLIHNSFGNASEYGLNNSIPNDVTIDARTNWWGHASGPYHATDRPGGQGVEIVGKVQFDTWLTEHHSYVPLEVWFWSDAPSGIIPIGLKINLTGVISGSERHERYEWTSSISGEFSNGVRLVVNITFMEPGNHSVTFRVLDIAGIWSEGFTMVFEVVEPVYPNMIPRVGVISPADGDRVSGVAMITGNATDPDGEIVSVEVTFHDHVIAWNHVPPPGNWSSWSLEWNTTTVENGTYRIGIRGFDGTDYSEVVWITVTVANEGDPDGEDHDPPQETDEGFIPGFGTITFICSTACTIIITIKRSKRKRT